MSYDFLPEPVLPQTFRLLAEWNGKPFRRAYYPCCHDHALPMEVLPSCSVVYLDIDPRPLERLMSAGVDAVCADALAYILDPMADLLVLFNPAIPNVTSVLRSLAPGGTVLANEWHGTATHLNEMSGVLEFAAAFVKEDNGRVSLNANPETLAEYFEQANDEVEFRKRNPMTYDYFKKPATENGYPDDVLGYLRNLGASTKRRPAAFYAFRKLA